jgi:hypothetical protein
VDEVEETRISDGLVVQSDTAGHDSDCLVVQSDTAGHDSDCLVVQSDTAGHDSTADANSVEVG